MRGNIVAIGMLMVSAVSLRAGAEASPPPPDARFVPAILKAAAAYRRWGRVDERLQVAPELCAAPGPSGDDGVASRVRMSRVDGPHEDKLYYLWASHAAEYRALGQRDEPLSVGFAVVKESFSAKPLVGPPDALPSRGPRDDARPRARLAPAPITWLKTKDGKRLQVDQPKDLFVMVKVGAQAGADEGWVYGTVSPRGKVTSAGRVEQCMGCHEAANHERMFGLVGE